MGWYLKHPRTKFNINASSFLVTDGDSVFLSSKGKNEFLALREMLLSSKSSMCFTLVKFKTHLHLDFVWCFHHVAQHPKNQSGRFGCGSGEWRAGPDTCLRVLGGMFFFQDASDPNIHLHHNYFPLLVHSVISTNNIRKSKHISIFTSG